MPRRKASKVPSRARPAVPDESLAEAVMHQEQRMEKMRLLLQDFDFEVEKQVKKMETEIQIIQESIQQLYKMDLMSYSEASRKLPWKDYIQQNGKMKNSQVTDSVNSVISSAESALQTVARKRGRKRKVQNVEDDEVISIPPPTVAKSTRSARQRAVLSVSQRENMLPPSTNTKSQRTKAVEPVATPMNQGVPPSFTSALFVTPKFDPRTPLPPGTIKRKPLLGEVAISLRGSPLQVSPAHTLKEGMEGWMSTLNTDNLDEETKSKLVEFHKKVGALLSM